jgi:hypothetical protein
MLFGWHSNKSQSSEIIRKMVVDAICILLVIADHSGFAFPTEYLDTSVGSAFGFCRPNQLQ